MIIIFAMTQCNYNLIAKNDFYVKNMTYLDNNYHRRTL